MNDIEKLKKWIKNPKNKKKLQKCLEQSLQEATKTQKYLKAAQKIDRSILFEPMTI